MQHIKTITTDRQIAIDTGNLYTLDRIVDPKLFGASTIEPSNVLDSSKQLFLY